MVFPSTIPFGLCAGASLFVIAASSCATDPEARPAAAGDASVPVKDGGIVALDSSGPEPDASPEVPDSGPACNSSGTISARPSGAFKYGRHIPNGVAGAAYATGSEGMWKEMKPLEYKWNYYPQFATTNQPFDKTKLIAYADGSHFTTARDANGHLLMDTDHSGDIDSPNGGFAFHEHAARGHGGVPKGVPFTNFWFDDNWLARYMTEAYDLPPPNGLSSYTDFTRWRILGGDTTNWTPYGSDFFDTLALDGLHAYANGNDSGALSKWKRILEKSNSNFNGSNQEFDYPSIDESYHLGLFGILTWVLIDSPNRTASDRAMLIQHAVSIRSHILSRQETKGQALLGWVSTPSDTNSLINIESIAVSVLALGAGASSVFEAEALPRDAANYFARPYHVVSAVTSQSTAGFLTKGPHYKSEKRSFTAEFYLRGPAPSASVGTLEVYDVARDKALVSRAVGPAELGNQNQWTRVGLDYDVSDDCSVLEFRTRWSGSSNLDVAFIRIR